MDTTFVYDNYEISGCYRLNGVGEKDPGGSSIERCDDDADADFWTLYGHIDGQGVEAIGDFASREGAEAVYQRIVGEPFAGSGQAGPRLKLMHAAPALLVACQGVVDRWEHGDLAEMARSCGEATATATAPCPPWVSAELDIAEILARRQQIASIWGIEDVQEVRPGLDDREAWQVLQATSRHHDANLGINWEILEAHAELLFGTVPEAEEEE